jgi:membrane associated rhomboid family serine protease
MLFLALGLIVWLFGAQDPALAQRLRLRPASPAFESLLTHHIFHQSGLHLGLNLLVIIGAGSLLESRWGTLRFLSFYLVIATGAGLVTVLAGRLALAAGAFPEEELISSGASAVSLGCLGALAALHPRRLVLRVLAARHLLWALMLLGGAGLALQDAAGASVDAPLRPFLLPQISGIGFALLFLRTGPLARGILESWRRRRARWHQERLLRLRQRVDELLDKINSRGYESLSAGEKFFLRQASRHFKGE